jgi:hypothetical protein
MRYYSKIRELVKLATALETEARKLAKGSQGRVDRMSEAEEYRLKALWLAGRITEDQYWEGMRECLDAKTYSV